VRQVAAHPCDRLGLDSLTLEIPSRPDTVEQLIRDHAPDERFAVLRTALANDALRHSLRELICDEDTVVDVGAVSTLLSVRLSTPRSLRPSTPGLPA
jgi:hypothetical protein